MATAAASLTNVARVLGPRPQGHKATCGVSLIEFRLGFEIRGVLVG